MKTTIAVKLIQNLGIYFSIEKIRTRIIIVLQHPKLHYSIVYVFVAICCVLGYSCVKAI